MSTGLLEPGVEEREPVADHASRGRLPLDAELVALAEPRSRERRTRRRRGGREPLLVFLLGFAVYAGLGIRLIEQHVVVFDAMSRLAHAYFAIYNEPPKLAAIGFEWPPVMTLVLLPLAAVKPLATSLYALPLTSAFFGAGMLVVINSALAWAGMRKLLRYPLVALFGIQPMIVFYSANGMSESVYLFFLVAGVYLFMRWHASGQSHYLALVGCALALATLSRYEIAGYAAVIGVAVAALLVAGRAGRERVEGSAMLYLAPIAYGLATWVFFNWLIVDDPFFWLTHQVAANQGGVGAEPAMVPGLGALASTLLELYAKLSPLAFVVVPALLLVAVLRRDLMSLALATVISLNALMTLALVERTGNLFLMQLRYNMRAIPLALLGVAWLYHVLKPRPARAAIWATATAVMVLALPLSWEAMRSWPHQFGDSAFVTALETGDDLEGQSAKGLRLGTEPEHEIADRVLALGAGPNAVLADDAQTFGVMLLSGRPDLFFDRIDRGDAKWLPVLESPFGKVDYVVAARQGEDKVNACFPGIATGTQPGFELVEINRYFLLARVEARAPVGQVSPAVGVRCPFGGSAA